MRWSFKIAEIAGIGIYIHATFLLLIAWLTLSYWLSGHSLASILAAGAFISALFGCILLHELGHALAAKKYGIQTRDITLLPIGGLARLERMPEDPKQELVVALAGPAVNVLIAGFIWAWLTLTSGLVSTEQLNLTGGPFMERLMIVNIFLVVFNLLPAFPMDGGRVLRALLATRLEYTHATQLAASVGQAMALVFGFIGLFLNPFLLFIALFVWIGAAQEASSAQIKSALGGIPVYRAMLTEFHPVSPRDTLGKLVELTLNGAQKDFPVVDGEKIVGVLTQNGLLAALTDQGAGTQVSQSMEREFQVADVHEMLEGVLARLQQCECHTLPVTRNGQLVGLVTMDNIGEFLSIQAALGKESRSLPRLPE